MPVHPHSAAANNSIAKTKPTNRQKVLKIIKAHRRISAQAVASKLNWPINCVSGRVTELKAAGLITEDGKATVAGRSRALLRVV